MGYNCFPNYATGESNPDMQKIASSDPGTWKPFFFLITLHILLI